MKSVGLHAHLVVVLEADGVGAQEAARVRGEALEVGRVGAVAADQQHSGDSLVLHLSRVPDDHNKPV